jgi:DNA-binding SARP family transcriptional activator
MQVIGNEWQHGTGERRSPAGAAPGSPRCAALRICVLGRFSLIRDDVPPPAGCKAHKRSHELLKALVAFGGRNVCERRLADTLWPDAEADGARQNLKSALHRLRRLIGKQAVTWREGRLSLGADCWVDAWECEARIDHALHLPSGAPAGELSAAVGAALALYHGPLLGDEEHAFALLPRERLRLKLLRAIARAADALLTTGAFDHAVAIVERGLDIDPLEDRLYETLMRAQIALGRHADALRTHARCTRQLRAVLGVAPSAAVEELCRRVQLTAAGAGHGASRAGE